MTRYIVLVQQGPYTRTVHGPYKTFKEAEGDARAWQGTVEPIIEKDAPAPDPSPYPEGDQERRWFNFGLSEKTDTTLSIQGVEGLVRKIEAWYPIIYEHDTYLFQHGRTPFEDAEKYRKHYEEQKLMHANAVSLALKLKEDTP